MKINFKKLLSDGYANYCEKQSANYPKTKYAFLAEDVFGFETYDNEKDDLFGRKAIEFCKAVSDGETYEYIKDDDNNNWFLSMAFSSFFVDKIEWGISIRASYWAVYQQKESPVDFGFLINNQDEFDSALDEEQWIEFVVAMIEFAEELKGN